MTTFTFNPLKDGRWHEFVSQHPAATVFHTSGWLSALQRTYGYQPVVYTTCSPTDKLTNGIALCQVESPLTGKRMVSLPFSDHCDPLVESVEECRALIGALQESARVWNYVELRPTRAQLADDPRLERSASFSLHTRDLRGSVDELLERSHESTVQRKIRRAEREGLAYAEGRSKALLREFYRLLVLTRRRHAVPPQPIEWFENLITGFGDSLKIRIAFKDRRAVGSIMTLHHRTTMVYKYGCSDAGFHRLGTMPFLFWRAVLDAKALGLEAFDLGRSDLSNTGLIAFKQRMDAVATPLTYFRCPVGRPPSTKGRIVLRAINRLAARLPDPLFVTAGRLFYRHAA
jgi:hypothetical protein